MLEDGDSLDDQVKAHARTSLHRYHALRVAADQRGSRWTGRLLLAVVILICWVVVSAAHVDEPWSIFVVGAIGGLVMVIGEGVIARVQVRRALRHFATQPR